MVFTVTAPFPERLRTHVASLDAAYRASMEAAAEHLRRSGMSARANRMGDRAPDFALRGADGAPYVLSAALGAGPVVLSFFRGEWCSFCRLEMDALLGACDRIVARGASLVMISPQEPTEPLVGRSEAVPGLTVLKDPLNGVALQYGLVFRMPDLLRHALLTADVDLGHVYATGAWLLPIPATYLVEPDGTISLAHVDPDFTVRLDPEEIIARLAARA